MEGRGTGRHVEDGLDDLSFSNQNIVSCQRAAYLASLGCNGVSLTSSLSGSTTISVMHTCFGCSHAVTAGDDGREGNVLQQLREFASGGGGVCSVCWRFEVMARPDGKTAWALR